MDFWSSVSKGNLTVLKTFLEKDSTLSSYKFGMTVLDYYLKHNHDYQTIQYLIEKRIPLTTFKIHFFLYFHSLQIFDLLFDSEKPTKENLNSLLVFQCKNQASIKAIEYVLKRGADPKTINKFLLIHLIKNQRDDLMDKIKLLINYGVDVNQTNEGEKALNFAISKNFYDIAKLLLDSGTILTIENISSIFNNLKNLSFKLEFIKLLCEKISDINSVDQGNSLLHTILKSESKNIEEIKIVLESGINPNLQNEGLTAIHLVSSEFNEDLFRLLINFGAEISIKNKNQETPIDILLSSSKFTQIFDILEKFNYKFDLNQKPPLIFRCFDFNKGILIEIIEKLVNFGADINEVHDKKCILNFFQIFNANTSILRKLFELGLDYEKMKGKTSFTLFPFNYEVNISSNKKTKLENLELLLEKKFPLYDSNSNENVQESIIEFVFNCQKPKEALELILNYGANPNLYYKKETIFSKIFQRVSKKAELFKVLIDYGIDIEAQKAKTNMKNRSSKYIQLIDKYGNIMQEFSELFSKGDLTDFNIPVEDGTIKAHKLIIEMRIGKENMTKFLENCQQKKQKEIYLLINFIYSGFVNELKYSQVEKLCEEFGIDFIKKKGRKGLIEDLEKLNANEESKDFTIKFDEKHEFKLHKLVLIARTDLFRNMFLSVNDSSNSVQNYSSFSFNCLNLFFKYLYSDSLTLNVSLFLLRELKNTPIYFQLNSNSSLDLKILEIQYYLRSKLEKKQI
ncbi:ankyrin repeat-containing protein [Anaeramoeba ignava]|uniref:Ankyrin repeat-containing protein n=1 Tax=Anaeramoeba ignava TaxID=1746090 RepID=A0A9Q0R474_ANAIG|nr:ankyrin repeat-containing protein [Anaeramoeba ignava]